MHHPPPPWWWWAAAFAAAAAGAGAVLCPQGHYYTGTLCAACPPFTYSVVPGATACVDCKAPGVYWSQTDGYCLQCPLGSYCPQYATDLHRVWPCPPGQYAGALGASACTHCSVGTFAADTASSACTPCDPGTYGVSPLPTQGAVSAEAACALCPPNTYSIHATATISACLACPRFMSAPTPGSTGCATRWGCIPSPVDKKAVLGCKGP